MASKLYLVCYDLNSPGQDYSRLIENIKRYEKWWHYLDSTWIIKSEDSAIAIRDFLSQFIDRNDELLVVKFGMEWAGRGFSAKAFSWLHKNAYKD